MLTNTTLKIGDVEITFNAEGALTNMELKDSNQTNEKAEQQLLSQTSAVQPMITQQTITNEQLIAYQQAVAYQHQMAMLLATQGIY